MKHVECVEDYFLEGTFIESCNCRVVCPCWLNDNPTEDHCAGFFAWRFDGASEIAGQPIDGYSVVVVSVHSDTRRGGSSEGVVFVDHRLQSTVAGGALVEAFAIDEGTERTDPLADLAPTLGVPVAHRYADISIGKRVDGWTVSVSDGAHLVVEALLSQAVYDASATPLVMKGTALDKELGVADIDDYVGFTAHRAERIGLHVAPLANANSDLVGRSGMSGPFRYDHRRGHHRPSRHRRVR